METCSETLLTVVCQEAQVAVGCTEPAMISLAAARAREMAGEPPVRISVVVSPAVAKNTQAVGLPRTDRKGVAMAAALGAVAGQPALGLEVLGPVTPEDVTAACALVDGGAVRVERDPKMAGLYAQVVLVTRTHEASVTIAGSHTGVVSAVLDGRETARAVEEAGAGEEAVAAAGAEADGHVGASAGAEAGAPARASGSAGCARSPLEDLSRYSFAEVYGAVMSAGQEEIAFLLDGARANRDLAEAALRGDCREAAAGFVHSLRRAVDSGQLISADLLTRVRLATAAAVSARMGGTPWAVLTSGGSGNQGILVSVPVLLAAETIPVAPSAEVLSRALFLAHAVNVYLKAFTGELSAVCGAVTGGAGVAAAVAWLLGGGRPEVEKAVEIVVGGLYAIMCDGAKGSCAVKIGEGAANGVMAGQLALTGGYLAPGEGLVGRSLEETARLLGRLTRNILNQADDLMISGADGLQPDSKSLEHLERGDVGYSEGQTYVGDFDPSL